MKTYAIPSTIAGSKRPLFPLEIVMGKSCSRPRIHASGAAQLHQCRGGISEQIASMGLSHADPTKISIDTL